MGQNQSGLKSGAKPKKRKRTYENFRILMTTSRNYPIHPNLDQISIKYSFEDTKDFKQTFYEAMDLVNQNEYEDEDNFLWRRIIVNFLFMHCLIKERDSMGKYGKMILEIPNNLHILSSFIPLLLHSSTRPPLL